MIKRKTTRDHIIVGLTVFHENLVAGLCMDGWKVAPDGIAVEQELLKLLHAFAEVQP